jgi:CBS domain-containing protein
LLVKDLMVKNPTVIEKDQLVSSSIDLMRRSRVSRLPVMDGGNLVGIVTEKDIVAKLSSSRVGGLLPSSLRVSSIMTSSLKTTSPEADIIEAAKEMIACDVSGLPVIGLKGNLLGVVTKTSLLKLCLRINKIYVGQVMTKSPVSISPDARLVNAGRLLFEKNLSVLPVIDDGNLVGIVTFGLLALAMFHAREKTDRKHVDKEIRQVTVSGAMRLSPPFCHPDSKVQEAAKLMIEERLKGLPVLDYKDRLVGLVTKTNLTKLICNKMKV